MNLLLIGIASYYSIAGCLGCNPNFTMANGDQFTDYNLTIALTPANYRKYKNQFVTVTNMDNGKSVRSKITDSGGFEKYNRIADLSLSTKVAIDCSDLCKVMIKGGDISK